MRKIEKALELEHFWLHSEYATENHMPAADDVVIETAQARLGLLLPNAYTSIMRVQNGGAVRHNSFIDPITGRLWENVFIDGAVSLQNLMTLRDHHAGIEFGFDEHDWDRHLTDMHLILPLAWHGTDWYTCLDYRECGAHGDPAVIALEMINGVTETARVKNFSQLLEHLIYDGDEYVFGLSALPTQEGELLEALNRLLSVTLKRQGQRYSYFNGVYRAPDRYSVNLWRSDDLRKQVDPLFPEALDFPWILAVEMYGSRKHAVCEGLAQCSFSPVLILEPPQRKELRNDELVEEGEPELEVGKSKVQTCVPSDLEVRFASRLADARRGDVDAMLEVANCYEIGLCGPIDASEAIRWERMAAAKGSADAMAIVGDRCLVNGEHTLAYAWYELASRPRYDAGDMLEFITNKRDELRANLSADEWVAAQKIISTCEAATPALLPDELDRGRVSD